MIGAMAKRISPPDFVVGTGQNTDMVRAIAVSAPVAGSTMLYSSIVTTAPGGKTRIHHHGPCETSIYIQSGRAHYRWGPTGLEHAMDAGAGDFVYIPAGEIHVEENASDPELPGFARRVHGRRTGRERRRPRALLTRRRR